MLAKMQQSHFVKKYSVQFVNAQRQAVGAVLLLGQQAARVLADLAGRAQRVRPDDARQRARARRRRPRRRARLEVLFEGETRRRREDPGHDGSAREVRAKVVVDASGQAALLRTGCACASGTRSSTRARSGPTGRARTATPAGTKGATMVIQTPDKQGWFWYIPQHDNIVSRRRRGAVRLPVQGPRQRDFEQTYDEEVERTPGRSKKRIARTPRASPATSRRKDYSYRSTRVAGDGWVLVGDAFGFLDPLYSSGVLLALKSGELAADAIVDGLEQGRHLGGAARHVGRGLQPRRRSDAPAGLRVLRRLQLRQVRQATIPSCAAR